MDKFLSIVGAFFTVWFSKINMWVKSAKYAAVAAAVLFLVSFGALAVVVIHFIMKWW